MPDNISFNEIPVDIRTPGQYIEFDNTKAVQGLPNQERKILVIANRLSTGTVAADTPFRVLSAELGENAAGRGSVLAGMLVALKAANKYSDVWAIGLDDNVAGDCRT